MKSPVRHLLLSDLRARLSILALCGAGAFLISFYVAHALAWLLADPGCSCPAEKLILARDSLKKHGWAMLPAGFCLLAVLALLTARLRLPGSWAAPSVLALVASALGTSLFYATPAGKNLYILIPFNYLIPAGTPAAAWAHQAGAFFTSWSFPAMLGIFVLAYLAARLSAWFRQPGRSSPEAGQGNLSALG